MSTWPYKASPLLIFTIAFPLGSRMVPCARPSTLPGTLVDTRTYSSPDFTKSVAVPPSSALTLSTIVKSLFTLVEPKYKPGVVLSAVLSVPSALGAPNFAVSAFNIAIAFATFGSACAFPGLVMSVDVATKQPATRRPTRKLLRFMLVDSSMIDGRSATPRLPAISQSAKGQLDANQMGRSVGQAWRDGSPKYMAAMEPRAIELPLRVKDGPILSQARSRSIGPLSDQVVDAPNPSGQCRSRVGTSRPLGQCLDRRGAPTIEN